MTGTNCDLFTHKSSLSYLNHLVLLKIIDVMSLILTVFVFKVTIKSLQTNFRGFITVCTLLLLFLYFVLPSPLSFVSSQLQSADYSHLHAVCVNDYNLCSCKIILHQIMPLDLQVCPLAQQSNAGQCRHFLEVSRSHKMVGLLWTSDRPVEETST
jgi:hypothetical protein